MPAEPYTGYRVSVEIRTEGLEKSPGAAIQVGDGRGWGATRSSALTEEVKSATWKQASVDYISIADTKDLAIQTRRLSGGSKGRAWYRNLKVEKFTPENPGASPLLGVASSIKADGTVCLMIVNKSLTNAFATALEGATFSRARAWCLTGPAIDAVNEGVTNLVGVRPLDVKIEGGKAGVILPPFSMTAVELN
jgi:hypothetical protein